MQNRTGHQYRHDPGNNGHEAELARLQRQVRELEMENTRLKTEMVTVRSGPDAATAGAAAAAMTTGVAQAALIAVRRGMDLLSEPCMVAPS